MADMHLYEVRSTDDGSLILTMPYAAIGVPIPNLTAAQLTDTLSKLAAT
jgi:hypothetical protein